MVIKSKGICFLLLLGILLPGIHPAQAQYSVARMRQARIMLDYRGQPASKIKDSSSYSFSSHELGLNAFVPVYSRMAALETTGEYTMMGAFITPGLRVNNVDIGYIYDSRVLVNASLGAGMYYARRKGVLLATVQAQVNEDEFTISDAVPRYSGLFLYAHRSNAYFSYHLGMTYTYLYGDLGSNGFLFPVIGARFKTGNRSQLSITLPLFATYTKWFNSKLRLTASLKPNGGINRYENRFSLPTTDRTLMLRRRSFVAGADLYYQWSSSVTVGAGAGLVFGRKLFFTDQQNTQVYEKDMVKAGLQLALKVIWRPWQNTLRNKQKVQNDPAADPADEGTDVDMFGF